MNLEYIKIDETSSFRCDIGTKIGLIILNYH